MSSLARLEISRSDALAFSGRSCCDYYYYYYYLGVLYVVLGLHSPQYGVTAHNNGLCEGYTEIHESVEIHKLDYLLFAIECIHLHTTGSASCCFLTALAINDRGIDIGRERPSEVDSGTFSWCGTCTSSSSSFLSLSDSSLDPALKVSVSLIWELTLVNRTKPSLHHRYSKKRGLLNHRS